MVITVLNGWTTQHYSQQKLQQWLKQQGLLTNHSQNEMATEIVVSLIGGCFLVLVALIGKIGSDNKKDHGEVHKTLGRIEQKIDHHVDNHK